MVTFIPERDTVRFYHFHEHLSGLTLRVGTLGLQCPLDLLPSIFFQGPFMVRCNGVYT